MARKGHTMRAAASRLADPRAAAPRALNVPCGGWLWVTAWRVSPARLCISARTLHASPAAVARSQRRGGEAPRQETAVAVGEADLPARDRVLLEVLRETLAEEGLSDSDRNVIESAIDDTLQGRGDHALAEIEREALGPVEAAARSPETMTDEQALCVPRVSCL